MKQFLQLLGVLGLFAWTALGLFAWSSVKGEVQITILEEGAGDSVEVALFEDQLNTLRNDMDALVGSLDANFALLLGAMEDGDSSTSKECARIEQRLADLLRELPVGTSTQSAERAPLASLPNDEPVAPDTSTAQLEADEPIVLSESGSIEELDSIAEPVTETPPAPSVTAPRKSFLAFRLPSRDFHFDGVQTFELLEGLSRVGFDAQSTLHDFSGVSNRVSGEFRLDLAHPEEGIEGRVHIASDSLSTGLEGRDAAMLEHLDSEGHDEIVFIPTGLEPNKVDIDGQRLTGSLRGLMTIRGMTQEVTMAVQASVDESRRLVIEGEMPLRFSDYGVHVPDKLGVISVDDELRVWIHLRTRARSGGVSQ